MVRLLISIPTEFKSLFSKFVCFYLNDFKSFVDRKLHGLNRKHTFSLNILWPWTLTTLVNQKRKAIVTPFTFKMIMTAALGHRNLPLRGMEHLVGLHRLSLFHLTASKTRSFCLVWTHLNLFTGSRL